jgi:hypothetical protein
MSKVVNWPARFAEMIDFVGLTDADRQLIKASAEIIMAQADRLTDDVYDHMLAYPQARKFFVTAKDEPDAKVIESNKQTMLSWLRATATAPSNDGFVAQQHSPAPAVPQPRSTPLYHWCDRLLSKHYCRYPASTHG